ncbi:MAG TPA: hypothetical protein VHD86_17925, partial [Xanthobacteraceae bacterium]|nr:hypothetical protein [Xanthobacteraceae bacterium]
FCTIHRRRWPLAELSERGGDRPQLKDARSKAALCNTTNDPPAVSHWVRTTDLVAMATIVLQKRQLGALLHGG